MRTPGLLDGINILELGGEPAAQAGRVLADLGADVFRVSPAHCRDPLRTSRSLWSTWTHDIVASSEPDDHRSVAEIIDMLQDFDVIVDTPRDPNSVVLDPSHAPLAHWVHITPFGMTGPRSHWHATDLGIMAASGNMFATGDPDRAPVRPSRPASYAHVAGEVAFAVVSAVESRRRQVVDISMQECVTIANMGSAGRYFRTGARGARNGARIGTTREVWRTLDGFVSFGIRGGAARAASMAAVAELVTNASIPAILDDGTNALDQDWKTWSQNTASAAELLALEIAIGRYFAGQTMQSLYDIAVERNVMLAPAMSPREIYASEQLAARDFFRKNRFGDDIPRSFYIEHPQRGIERDYVPRNVRITVTPEPHTDTRVAATTGLWAGTNILEFGSGAAGPIANRYFVEHGATVLRIESASRPDFLRAMVIGPNNPHGLEGSDLYDALNCGKRHLTLNLKHPDGLAIVRRLIVEWADAVAENYAPRAMANFGLDYESLTKLKPDLVMISACLNGQTGPHRDYPGFGGQGAALSGWNWVTGWPDREPVGPFGTITDSLAPRYVAAALAAGIHHRRRTGLGTFIDISQVETGLYALSPWLVDFSTYNTIGMRNGNRSATAVPHGAFRCADEFSVNNANTPLDDRWIAIACHTDEAWEALAENIDLSISQRLRWTTFAQRSNDIDEVEAVVSQYCATRNRDAVADQLQASGIEAVPVADFGDLMNDPQLAHRDHFVALTHPALGEGRYERNGIRFSDGASGYWRAGPTLGQDNEWVLADLLGLTSTEIADLHASGALA